MEGDMKTHFFLSLCLALGVAFCALLGEGVAAAESPTLQAEQKQQIRKTVLEEIQRTITPYRRNHSKSAMNLDARFGTPEIKIDIQGEACVISISFPKGPFAVKEAQEFQMKSVQDALDACTTNGFRPASIQLTLYSQGSYCEGIATFSASDGMIRWKAK